MKHLLLGILLLALLFGCKKKKEEEPLPPKITYSDIPGSNIYIDGSSDFIDTGMVIIVKGSGFDVRYKNQYVIMNASKPSADFYLIDEQGNIKPEYLSNAPPPDVAKMISFSDTAIKYKFKNSYLGAYQKGCGSPDILSLGFYKYSKEQIPENKYKSRYLLAAYKKYTIEDFYKIIKDTVIIPKSKLLDVFMKFRGNPRCYDMQVGDYYSGSMQRLSGIDSDESPYSEITTLPEYAQNLSIPDGHHVVTLKRRDDNKEIIEVRGKKTIYFKNLK